MMKLHNYTKITSVYAALYATDYLFTHTTKQVARQEVIPGAVLLYQPKTK